MNTTQPIDLSRTRPDVGRDAGGQPRPRARPGLVAIFSMDQPLSRALALCQGHLELGRGSDASLPADPLMSRRHAEVRFRDGMWTVADFGSLNGTSVNGTRLCRSSMCVEAGGAPMILRVGSTLYIASEDVVPHLREGVRSDRDLVIGPSLASALEVVRNAARSGQRLLILGDSGSGKELAARTYHEGGRQSRGPFIAVNCAAIPEGVAERLLFGSTRGAFSGATDAVGYVQAADGGTLFLDEVADLAPTVQAKLLRVLETGEVLPLGGSRAQRVSVQYCFATARNLQHSVQTGQFRLDLLYRIASAVVTLPPLRARVEEIPWHVVQEIAKLNADLKPHVSLIEACALHSWPGNVRELRSSIHQAASQALCEGAPQVEASHLRLWPTAPSEVDKTLPVRETTHRASGSGTLRVPFDPNAIGADTVRAALAEQRGNLAATARHLGVHRSQLYRLLQKHGIQRTLR